MRLKCYGNSINKEQKVCFDARFKFVLEIQSVKREKKSLREKRWRNSRAEQTKVEFFSNANDVALLPVVSCIICQMRSSQNDTATIMFNVITTIRWRVINPPPQLLPPSFCLRCLLCLPSLLLSPPWYISTLCPAGWIFFMALRSPLSSTHNIHTHTHRNLYTQRKEEKIQLQLLRYLMHRRGEKIPIRRTINKVTRIVFFPSSALSFGISFLFLLLPCSTPVDCPANWNVFSSSGEKFQTRYFVRREQLFLPILYKHKMSRR